MPQEKRARFFSPDNRTRRKRIKESRKYIFYVDGFCQKAIRVPEKEFKREDYAGVIFYQYGNDYFVFPEWTYTVNSYQFFTQMVKEDCVLYATLYEDLDGTIAQTPFKRF